MRTSGNTRFANDVVRSLTLRMMMTRVDTILVCYLALRVFVCVSSFDQTLQGLWRLIMMQMGGQTGTNMFTGQWIRMRINRNGRRILRGPVVGRLVTISLDAKRARTASPKRAFLTLRSSDVYSRRLIYVPWKAVYYYHPPFM